MAQHQMSTTPTGTDGEFALNCTCLPTGTLFTGSKAGCARNMVQHQDQAKDERAEAKGQMTPAEFAERDAARREADSQDAYEADEHMFGPQAADGEIETSGELVDVIMEALDEWAAENQTHLPTSTYRDVGMMTTDDGLTVGTPGGAEFQVRVIRSR